MWTYPYFTKKTNAFYLLWYMFIDFIYRLGFVLFEISFLIINTVSVILICTWNGKLFIVFCFSPMNCKIAKYIYWEHLVVYSVASANIMGFFISSCHKDIFYKDFTCPIIEIRCPQVFFYELGHFNLISCPSSSGGRKWANLK